MNAVPSTLLYQLSAMLEAHHAEHLLAAVSTAAAPHIRAYAGPAAASVLVDVRLVVSLHRVLSEHGQSALLPDVLAVLSPFLTGDPARRDPVLPVVDAGLTDREVEVLRGFSQGRTHSEIGRSLGISEHTAKTHARRLFGKLEVRDRAHAVHQGHLLGYLDDGRPHLRTAS